MPADLPVVAIIAAYNEADVIEQVVCDLVRQDVCVYLLDDGSTDGTSAAIERYLGRGVLAIERLPDTSDPGTGRRFDWERILRRKSDLARQLDGSWFIHHDADEFRESPWPHLSLRDAIRHVDALGYNAIDFASFDFWPTHDRFRPGDDLRAAFPYCSPAAAYDRLQVRCWKKTEHAVDLTTSGGHDVAFPGRRVFPLRFILRHYPIRGQAHGERKIFQERRDRFRNEERAKGWHVQYDAVRPGHSFVRDPSTLTAFDADAVRVGLAEQHRETEALQASVEARARELESCRQDLVRARDALGAATAEAVRLRGDLERRGAELAATRAELEQRYADLAELHQSLSWRWTAPARAAYRVLRRG